MALKVLPAEMASHPERLERFRREGRSSAELASAILRDPPPPLEQSRSDLPEDLRRIISRGLQKRAEDRFGRRDASRLSSPERTSTATARSRRVSRAR